VIYIYIYRERERLIKSSTEGESVQIFITYKITIQYTHVNTIYVGPYALEQITNHRLYVLTFFSTLYRNLIFFKKCERALINFALEIRECCAKSYTRLSLFDAL